MKISRLVLFLSILIWGLLIISHFLHYDLNIGMGCLSFLLSLFFSICALICLLKNKLRREQKRAIYIFLLTSSPLTLFIFLYLFSLIGMFYHDY